MEPEIIFVISVIFINHSTELKVFRDIYNNVYILYITAVLPIFKHKVVVFILLHILPNFPTSLHYND